MRIVGSHRCAALLQHGDEREARGFAYIVGVGREGKAKHADRELFGLDKLNVPRSDIPAVTHVDYSGRVHTVHEETNPRYHRLLKGFKQRTGYSVLVNTSFNVRGEPIVCTPEDAYRCFMGTEMETLVIGGCLLKKRSQDPALAEDYRHKFELD